MSKDGYWLVFTLKHDYFLPLTASLMLIIFAPNLNAGVLSSRCALPYESQVPKKWTATCLAAQAGSHWRQDLTTSVDNINTPLSHNGAQLIHYEIYLAHHFNPHFSLHAQSRYHRQAWTRGLSYLEEQNEEISYYAQLGHTVLDPFSYTIGKFRQPFGIDLRLTPSFLVARYKEFWPQASPGAAITINPNTVTSYEFGMTFKDHTTFTETPLSFRINTTIPSLNGTRIVGSLMRDKGKKESFGIGLINNAINYRSSLEWVRSLTFSDNNRKLSQIFRLNYQSMWKEEKRWAIEFENFKNDGLLVTYSEDFLFFDYLTTQISASYQTAGLERKAPRLLLGGGIKCEI